MLAIEVGGEFLDLAGAKVRLKLESQVFARDFVAQGYSYPFTIPWTPNNARLLGHLDRIANVGSMAPVNGNLWLGGMKWRPCELVLRKFTGTGWDMDLRTPEDQLILDLKGQYLQDFAYGGPFDLTPGGIALSDFDQVYHDHTGDIDTTPFVFAPIRNSRRFGGRNEAYLNVDPDEPTYDANIPDAYINYYNAPNAYDWFYYNTDPDIQVFFHEFSPFFYLAYIAEELAAELGYQLVSDVFEDEEVRRQVIIGNQHLGMMVVTQGGLLSSPDTDGYHSLDAGDALPRMTAYAFWVKLMRRYCAVLRVKNGTIYFRSINAILDDGDVLDLSEHAVPGTPFEVDEQDGFELKALTEPLETIEASTALPAGDILGTVNTVPFLSGLSPSVGDIAFVVNMNAYYQYNVGSGSNGWVFYSHNLYPVTDGEEQLKLDVGVVLTKMYNGVDEVDGTREWLLPEVDQGLSDNMADWHVIGDSKAQELRLLFYRGLQQDSAFETYPLLTNGTQDYAGTTITDAVNTERLDSTGGIYETWYSRWVSILQANRSSERKVRLPLHTLLSFDFTTKVRIDGLNYLVRSIDVEVTTTGIGLATLDLVKL